MAAYVPGEQPESSCDVKLNTNENPYPPANEVLDAVAKIGGEQLRRYPPSTAHAFRDAAAEAHGVKSEQIIATNGGDELLRLAVTVFCGARGSDDSGGGLGIGDPGYELYPVIASIHDSPLLRIPLKDTFALPDDFAEQADAGGCRLVIVANPHAPSGRLEPLDRLTDLARKLHGRAVLLIDEAYVDFASCDALPLVAASSGLDNVLLLRSLSKGYSLAGLRFGYGIAHPRLIAMMHKARDSYNTDVLAQAAATSALKYRDAAARSWLAVIGQRQRMIGALTHRGFAVLPSESNFVLVTPPQSRPCPDAVQMVQKLKQKGVYVRYFDRQRLSDKLRITIGTPQQNDLLLKAVDEVMG